MLDVLSQSDTLLQLGMLVLIAVIWVRITREPWYDMAIRIAGFAAFIVGVRWVMAVEPELGLAVMLASGGFALAVWSPKLPIGDRARSPDRSPR